MTSLERIEKVEDILKNEGMIQKTQLAKRLMNEYQMAYQTALNAINDAEKLGKIFSYNKKRKNQSIIYYSSAGIRKEDRCRTQHQELRIFKLLYTISC